MFAFLLTLAFWAPDSAPWYEHYRRGQEAFYSKDYRTAVVHLEAAVTKRPESKKAAKTYGVQFIEYYPYQLLAQSYYWTDDYDNAKRVIRLAEIYGEMQDERISASLAIVLDSIKTIQNALTEAQPSLPTPQGPDLIPVFEKINNQAYFSAASELEQLIKAWPEDESLITLSNLLSDLAANRVTLNQARSQTQDRIQNLLEQARQDEQAGNLKDALAYYKALQMLEPNNPTAAQAISELRAKMAAEGRSEAEIQKAFELSEELLEKRRQQLSQARQKNDELAQNNINLLERLKEIEQVQSRPPPILENRWILIPKAGRFIADISASVSGNVPLKSAVLYINGKKTRNWSIGERTSFRIPLIRDYLFPRNSNQLMLTVQDVYGRQHRWRYPYTFQARRKLWSLQSQRVMLLITIAFLGLIVFIRVNKSQKAFRLRFNPYIAGAPVLNQNMFYGRGSLLKQIMNTLHNNSLMIYGERRIGKTSFLHQLQNQLPKMEDPEYEFVTVFIDLQGVQEEQFFAVILQEIIDVLTTRGFEPPETAPVVDVRLFTRHMRKMINYLKQTCRKQPKLVLLLDEVDIMNGFSEKTNQQLRSVFMKGFAKHLVAVMAGIHINTTWKSEGSPWYNFFEQLELKPFSKDNARSLVASPVKGVYQFSNDAVDKILELSHCKPYLIQKFCVNLVAHALNQNRRKITLKDVEYVFQEIKSEVWVTE